VKRNAGGTELDKQPDIVLHDKKIHSQMIDKISQNATSSYIIYLKSVA